jgi:muramidase (phage lysozyme)
MPTLKPDPRFAAFLDLIAWSEGTSTHKLTHFDGYDVIVSGVDGLHTFADFSAHPFAGGREPILVRAAVPLAVTAGAVSQPAVHSTASGRYQITLPTWSNLSCKISLPTFAPQFQDAAALGLIEEAHATAPLLNNAPHLAITRCAATWASFPGNDYGQGGRSLTDLLSRYDELLQTARIP